MEDENNSMQTMPVNTEMPRCMAFFGCYEHSLDGKGRLIIPNAYRKPLGSTFTISITREADGIALYPESVFDEFLMELFSYNRMNDSVSRYLAYLGKMTYRGIEADSQGRILLPARLRRHMLQDVKEVHISGAMDHVRIFTANRSNEDDEYFTNNRKSIIAEMSALQAGLMARKGDS